eukprot:s3254_g2.t1
MGRRSLTSRSVKASKAKQWEPPYRTIPWEPMGTCHRKPPPSFTTADFYFRCVSGSAAGACGSRTSSLYIVLLK